MKSEKLISEIQNSTNEYISSAEKLKSKLDTAVKCDFINYISVDSEHAVEALTYLPMPKVRKKTSNSIKL